MEDTSCNLCYNLCCELALIKRGSLVYDCSTERHGIVLTWLSLGGTGPTFWEILYENGIIDGAFEDDLEIINV